MARRIGLGAASGRTLAAGPSGGSLAREIDENLRRVYQAALTDEVPDRFRELLAKLREREAEAAGAAPPIAGAAGAAGSAGTAPEAEDAP